MPRLQRDFICSRLKQARELAGLSQAEAAEALGLHHRTLQNYERDRVPWEELHRFADFYGVSLVWLLWGDEVPVEMGTLDRRLEDLSEKLDALLDAQGVAEMEEAAIAAGQEPRQPGARASRAAAPKQTPRGSRRDN